MALFTEHVYSSLQQWKDGPITCFSWPSDQTDFDILELGNIGSVVNIANKMPQWRWRIANGLSATTTLDALRTSLTYTPGFLLCGKWCAGTSQRFGFYQFAGDLLQGQGNVWNKPPAAPTVIDPETRDLALSRAIKDARSKQSHFRGGNFIAELRDTIRGLRNPVKGFRNLLDTYHGNARRRVRRAVGRRSPPVTQHDFRRLERDAPDVARAAQRALSDSWLEANFGWQPLLSDAVDAYQALRRISATVPLARFFGRSDREDPPSFATSSRLHNGVTVRADVLTYIKYDVTFYGAVKVEVSSPTGRAVEEMGVNASNFFPAVWEAIPYSFLIDYFSNVGDIIETVSFPRSDIAWLARTYRNHSIRSTDRVVATAITSPAFPASNSVKLMSFQPQRVEWNRSHVNRQPYSDSIVPSLRFEIPGSKNWRKWCNVGALARLRTL